MENRADHPSHPLEDDRLVSSVGDLVLSPPLLQGQSSILQRRKRRKPFATRKRALFGGFTLLLILGVSLLALRVLTKPGPMNKWSFQAENGIFVFSPLVTNGMVYALNEDASDQPNNSTILDALDTLSGREKWSERLQGSVLLSPNAVNGMIYIIVDNHITDGETILALDAASGSKQWSFQTEGIISSSSALTIANGIVYILSNNGELDALDALSGQKRWVERVGENALFPPMVADGMVYVVSNDLPTQETIVSALDAVSGAHKWSFRAGSFTTAPLVVTKAMVYVSTASGRLYALDGKTGAQTWSYSTGSAIYTSPTVMNGSLYVGNTSGFLYALNAASGSKRWFFQVGTALEGSLAVVNGMVYAVSTAGTLYALDESSGQQKWSSAGDFPNLFTKPILVSGSIYVYTRSGMLYALNAFSGSKNWSSQVEEVISSSPTIANRLVYVESLNKLDAIQPPGANS